MYAFDGPKRTGCSRTDGRHESGREGDRVTERCLVIDSVLVSLVR